MIALALVIVALPFIGLHLAMAIGPVGRELGLTNGSGQQYLYWSGVFSDATIFVAALVFAAHHNCHARWCWRIGRHGVDGSPWVVCQRHHPEHKNLPSHPTGSDITRHHRLRQTVGTGDG